MAGDLDQFLADGGSRGDLGLEGDLEGRLRDRDDLAVGPTQGLGTDEGGAVLHALQPEDIGGEGLGLDPGLVDPEVGVAVELAKADLVLPLVLRLVRRRPGADPALGELPDERTAVIQLGHGHGRGPEDGGAVEEHQAQQTDDHAEADDQAQATEPDPGFAAGRAAVGRGGHGQTTL